MAKKKTTKKKPEALEEIENEIGFVWDENEMVKRKNFVSDKMNDKVFYFGHLIPENIKKLIGKGKDAYEKVVQEETPVLITSDKKLVRVNVNLAKKEKIKFGDLPPSSRSKWKLEDIRKFLDGNTEKVDGKKMLDLMINQYKKYIYSINEKTPLVQSVWDGTTYSHQLCEAFPILHNQGLSGSGKTKKMVISSSMSFNGGSIQSSDTEATIFREKAMNRGTSYADEVEKLFPFNSKSNTYDVDPKVEIYNASYSKVGVVYRNEKVGVKYKLVPYELYSPTQMASIGSLRDPLNTRAITIISTKSPNNDGRGELDPLEDINDPIWSKIRDMNYRFALENWERFEELYKNFPKDTGLKRRDFQIWKPLLTFVKLIDEDYYKELLDYAIQMSKRKEYDFIPETSFDYKILRSLKILVENEPGKIPTKKITQTFKSLYPQNEDQKSKEMYLTRNISQHLDKLGFMDLRKRDGDGSFFDVSIEIFNAIVIPICPDLKILCVKMTIDEDDVDDVDENLPERKKGFLGETTYNKKNNILSSSSTPIYTDKVKGIKKGVDVMKIDVDSKIEVEGVEFEEC